MKSPALATLASLVSVLAVSAAELGMEAPPLKVASWVRGGPVDVSQGRGTNVYVVEFWATWCAPCRASIPHLSALQKRFKDRDVVVVGVSDEREEAVRPFVERMGEQMNYVVAVDDGEQTSTAYLKAFDVAGIPHAFVIDQQGRVAWQGHPMAGLDQAVEDILEGRHDIETAKRVLAAEKSMRDYFDQAAEAESATATRELGEQVVRDGGTSPALLNTFSWIILTHPGIQHRDLELATRAARIAYERTEGKDASIADTYARAFFEAGQFSEAVAMQKKAIGATTDPAEREQLEKTLQDYEARLN